MAPRQALHQRLPKDMPTMKMQSAKHIEEEATKVKIQIINLQQLLPRIRDSVDAAIATIPDNDDDTESISYMSLDRPNSHEISRIECARTLFHQIECAVMTSHRERMKYRRRRKSGDSKQRGKRDLPSMNELEDIRLKVEEVCRDARLEYSNFGYNESMKGDVVDSLFFFGDDDHAETSSSVQNEDVEDDDASISSTSTCGSRSKYDVGFRKAWYNTLKGVSSGNDEKSTFMVLMPLFVLILAIVLSFVVIRYLQSLVNVHDCYHLLDKLLYDLLKYKYM